MAEPETPNQADEPPKHRLGIVLVADRRWKLWAQVVILCLVIAGMVRLDNWLF